MNNKRVWIGVTILLLIVAAVLRLYRLEGFITFLGDQGRDTIIIKRIATLEHLPAIGPPSSIGMIFLGPFFYYLMAPFLLLARFNPVGMAYATAAMALISIIFFFVKIKREINFAVALIFTTLVSLSYVNIEYSRFAWNPNLLPFFAFATLYFWYRTLQAKRWHDAVAFGLLFGFSVQLHHLAFLMALPVALTFIETIWHDKHKKPYWISAAFSICAFLVAIFPLILFDLKHDFLNSLNFIKLFTEKNVVANDSLLYRILDTNNYFFSFIFQSDLNRYFSLLLLVLLAVLYVYMRRNRKIPLLVTVNAYHVLTYILIFSVLTSPRYPHYFNSVYLSFFLTLAYLGWQSFKQPIFKYAVIGLFLIVFTFLNLKQITFFANEPNYQIQEAKTVADSILKRVKAHPYQIVSLPATESNGHIRYYLEVDGERPMPEDSFDQPAEIFAICSGPCEPVGNAQYQLAAFKNGRIAESWHVMHVTIYRIVHFK